MSKIILLMAFLLLLPYRVEAKKYAVVSDSEGRLAAINGLLSRYGISYFVYYESEDAPLNKGEISRLNNNLKVQFYLNDEAVSVSQVRDHLAEVSPGGLALVNLGDSIGPLGYDSLSLVTITQSLAGNGFRLVIPGNKDLFHLQLLVYLIENGYFSVRIENLTSFRSSLDLWFRGEGIPNYLEKWLAELKRLSRGQDISDETLLRQIIEWLDPQRQDGYLDYLKRQRPLSFEDGLFFFHSGLTSVNFGLMPGSVSQHCCYIRDQNGNIDIETWVTSYNLYYLEQLDMLRRHELSHFNLDRMGDSTYSRILRASMPNRASTSYTSRPRDHFGNLFNFELKILKEQARQGVVLNVKGHDTTGDYPIILQGIVPLLIADGSYALDPKSYYVEIDSEKRIVRYGAADIDMVYDIDNPGYVGLRFPGEFNYLIQGVFVENGDTKFLLFRYHEEHKKQYLRVSPSELQDLISVYGEPQVPHFQGSFDEQAYMQVLHKYLRQYMPDRVFTDVSMLPASVQDKIPVVVLGASLDSRLSLSDDELESEIRAQLNMLNPFEHIIFTSGIGSRYEGMWMELAHLSGFTVVGVVPMMFNPDHLGDLDYLITKGQTWEYSTLIEYLASHPSLSKLLLVRGGHHFVGVQLQRALQANAEGVANPPINILVHPGEAGVTEAFIRQNPGEEFTWQRFTRLTSTLSLDTPSCIEDVWKQMGLLD